MKVRAWYVRYDDAKIFGEQIVDIQDDIITEEIANGDNEHSIVPLIMYQKGWKVIAGAYPQFEIIKELIE